VANLVVTVKPNPLGALMLFSFETGTEGWAVANWSGNEGIVSQSADYHSDGNYSLKIDTAGVSGGWFGVTFAPSANLVGKTHLKLDIKTLAAGTSQNVAIQVGDSWEWCQSTWGWINAGTTTTVDIDLLNLSCSSPDLTKVQGMYVWFSGGGTFYMDNVRAE
jgi:mannan endo-1,4-beta-mannosidase